MVFCILAKHVRADSQVCSSVFCICSKAELAKLGHVEDLSIYAGLCVVLRLAVKAQLKDLLRYLAAAFRFELLLDLHCHTYST